MHTKSIILEIPEPCPPHEWIPGWNLHDLECVKCRKTSNSHQPWLHKASWTLRRIRYDWKMEQLQGFVDIEWVDDHYELTPRRQGSVTTEDSPPLTEDAASQAALDAALEAFQAGLVIRLPVSDVWSREKRRKHHYRGM